MFDSDDKIDLLLDACGSRPTRGVWIEIGILYPLTVYDYVTPHTGRVD